MDKKTKTIVIIVLVAIVAGGLYYGVNRWRQQRLVNQILKEAYGVNTGLLSGLTGSGSIQDQIAREMAQDEAKQKADEEREAAKTPEDRFNETESVSLTGNMSSLVKSVIEPPLNAVFGKIKPTLFSGNYLGQEGSFLVAFKIPKIPTSDDMNKLVEEFTGNGYTVAMNSIAADSANILFEKGKIIISVSYENPEEQEIGVLYMEQAE
ncbi:MAG: hypothetical protein WC310_03435 [Patescibacteria group bacterium]|jgi:hypothetical protein